MLYIFLKKSKLSCYTYFLKFISKFKNTSQIYITMLIMAGDINSLNLLVVIDFDPFGVGVTLSCVQDIL